MKILVSGACGVTSRAIVRSIKMSEKYKSATIIGTGILHNSYGLYEGLYDRIWRVPHVREDSYGREFQKILAKEEIDSVILIPELEILFWTKQKLHTNTILPPEKFSEIAISKEKLYKTLVDTDLIPKSEVVELDRLKLSEFHTNIDFPFWVRSVSEGSTSGKGSMIINNKDYLQAYKIINEGIGKVMISEYLPGRNIAVHLLYKNDKLYKVACYERLEYFRKEISISGVTGNISKGKLVNDSQAVEVAKSAVEEICRQTGEVMDGLIAVDLKGTIDNKLLVTEINLRYVAATSSFAAAGFNLTEYHLDSMDSEFTGFSDGIEKEWPENNQILRDIDGEPIWIEDYKVPELGKSFPDNF